MHITKYYTKQFTAKSAGYWHINEQIEKITHMKKWMQAKEDNIIIKTI